MSKVIMVTSTPCDYISNLCDKYLIPLYVNTRESGIVQDWNFALECAEAEYVTITHQDDVYLKDYADQVIKQLDSCKRPIIFSSDYGEIRDSGITLNNKLLRVKRFMIFPLRFRLFQKSVLVRRCILSFGSPICCPSVTYVKKSCPKVLFEIGFRSNQDWQTWEKLSRIKGEFVYSSEILMYHRIHEDSETSKIIGDKARGQEDFQMFCKFWPRFIAKVLTKMYSLAEKSNSN